MASKPVQKEAKKVIKEVAKELSKDAKNPQQRRPWPRRRWWKQPQAGQSNQAKIQVKKVADKEVARKMRKEGLEGPRSRFSVRVSATIGRIGPNKEQGPELQLATFMHPSLMKEPNDGTNFGPLQAAAAQWGLWRISNLTVRFTPLVGASAVTGSMFRVSLNLTQSPGNASWGGLGARKHMDVPVGKQLTWKLARGDLAGPRQTWWMTDTNEEGGQSCGPMVEIHGLGKTSSTYQDRDWTGDLFVVEVDGRWEFTNYNAKPALGTLDRKTESYTNEQQSPGIEVGEDGIMKMMLPAQSNLAKFMSDASERSALNEGSIGETIWQIVDEGAGLAANVAPTPFSWLIKGAWWFVKKLAGRAANADDTYIIYASLADAQNNKPVMANRFALNRQPTTLTVTQVNSPNVGPGVTQAAYHTENPYPLVPAAVPPPPGSTVAIMGQFYPLLYAQYNGVEDSIVKALPRFDGGQYLFQLKKGATTCSAQGAYRILNGVCVTLSEPLHDRIIGCYDPMWLDFTGITLHIRETDQSIGQVVGYAIDTWGPPNAPFTAAVWLVRVTRTVSARDWTAWSYVSGLYDSGGSALTPPIQVTARKACVPTATGANSTTHDKVRINQPQLREGDLLVVYSIGNNKGGQPGFTNVQPVDGNTNDRVLGRHKDGDHGFWASALCPVAPQSDYGVVKFRTPRPVDPEVERIVSLVQHHFSITPRLWDDDSSVDDDSDDDGGPYYESPDLSPQVKLAKEKMYEALRETDWDHVDAQAIMQAIASSRTVMSRGHAE